RLLARADALRRRVRADGRARDGDQRRLDARAARSRHLPRSLASPAPARRRRHAAPWSAAHDRVRWVDALRAIAQSGLTYAESPFDHERYEAVRRVAAELAASVTSEDAA